MGGGDPRAEIPPAGVVTRMLEAWSRGNVQARDALIPVVYQELRRRAAAYLRREQSGHTLRPTDLVHEAYLRLCAQDVGFKNRGGLTLEEAARVLDVSLARQDRLGARQAWLFARPRARRAGWAAARSAGPSARAAGRRTSAAIPSQVLSGIDARALIP